MVNVAVILALISLGSMWFGVLALEDISIDITMTIGFLNDVHATFSLDVENFHDPSQIIQNFCSKYLFSPENCNELSDYVHDSINSQLSSESLDLLEANNPIESLVQGDGSLDSTFNRESISDYDLIAIIEDLAEEISIQYFNFKSLCIIHLSSQSNKNSDISDAFEWISNLIALLERNKVLENLDYVWILNYIPGLDPLTIQVNLANDLGEKIRIKSILSKVDYGEIPTLKLIQRVSKRLPDSESLSILYLNSEGGTTKTFDSGSWQDLLVHYLSANSQSWYHLLQSKEFDIIGSDHSLGKRLIRGNMFWTTTEYLRKLQPLNIGYHGGRDAENWFLSSSNPRIHVPFKHEFNDANTCSAQSDSELSCLTEWSEVNELKKYKKQPYCTAKTLGKTLS